MDAQHASFAFKRAVLGRSSFTGAILQKIDFEGVDLRQVIRLTREQLEGTSGDERTVLPDDLERPNHWFTAEERRSAAPRRRFLKES